MQSRLGENITREWSEEQSASELWDALQLIKTNGSAGAQSLNKLAGNGSALAMMYLGHSYSKGLYGLENDDGLAEDWLKRAAKVSIEGAYQLAYHYQRAGRYDEAIGELQKLADLQYTPAIFGIGWIYYKGEVVERNIEKALFYFSMADRYGHLHAANWIGKIQMRENMGVAAWLRGFMRRIGLFVPFVAMAIRYPNSDRLRT